MKKAFLKRSLYPLVVALSLLAVSAGYNLGVSAESAYEKIRILVDILDQIQTNYVEAVEIKELVYGAAAGMVKTLDPFSQFLPPENLKEMKVETEGEFGGIGIRVGVGEDGWLTVVTPLPGTPAFKAGVYPRDKIIKIDGATTEGITLEKAVNKLRGKPGSKVVINITREEKTVSGEMQNIAKEFPLQREIIKIQTIYSRMLSGTDIGYVRIVEFNARTPQDIHEMLAKLAKEGMKGLVLDLRFNPGGLLPSAIETAKEFIGEEKIVVYTQGRRPDSRVEYRAAHHAPHAGLPMVVLINEGSASGSEILAGALQDHKRAILVGARSFGKASVQSVINLGDGSGLRLTTAYYYTPNGRLIHKKEFTRKKPTELAAEDKKDPDAVEPDEEIVETAMKNTAPKGSGKGAVSAEASAGVASADKEKSKEAWGIEPDIEVKVDKSMAAKIYESFDVAYFPDKPSETQTVREVFKKNSKTKKDGKDKPAKPESGEDGLPPEAKDEPMRDQALERALELFKARSLLLQMPE